jgi:uncharacterized protein YrzB (UPF0473 family)
MDLLSMLLDEDNHEPIILYDDEGKMLEFEQVAVIPHLNQLYCLLQPISDIEGVGKDEVLAFRLDEDDKGNFGLKLESDETAALAVSQKFYALLDDARKNAEGS